MTALFLDGFDHYGTGNDGIANMLDGVWASATRGGQGFSITSPSWGAPRTGTGCLRLNSINLDSEIRYIIPGAPAKMYMSFGFAVDFVPGSRNLFMFETRDVANVSKYSLMVESTGAVSLWSGHGGTRIATTAGPVIRAQTWHFIELCVDYTAGTFTLRVDDPQANQTPALSATISTGLVNAQMIFGCFGGVPNSYWDDLFIRDAAGTANNSWIGDRRIATLMVNQDTTEAGWTPSYYHKFGAGVLQVAHMVPNQNIPISENACVTAATSTGFNVGTADFTIESFVRFQKVPDPTIYATIFSRWSTSDNNRSYRLLLGGSSFNNSCLQVDYTTDGTTGTLHTPITFPWTPNLNQWYHIALVRASGELLLFVDGSQMGLPIDVSADTFFAANALFSIGAETANSGVLAATYLTGMYDETRFTNGFARYTTSFAPPTDPFPRGSPDDPEWADVTLLCGYNTAIQDESSFARALTARNGAISFPVNDGPDIGVYSTIDKRTPDDNTFISAALEPATGILTMATQPSNGDTVTVGTSDGSTPAVYTFKTSVTTAFDVLIDTTAQNTLINLQSAINATAGAGTKYGTGTLANADVSAVQLPAGQLEVIALIAGTGGNTVATTATGTAATWGDTTLNGGANIPGPSDFKVERPPANTTIISAIQSTVRAYKSDAGVAVLQNAIVGPLGGIISGDTHALATNAGYYLDVIEEDPDTSGPITPATLINGKLRINRTE